MYLRFHAVPQRQKNGNGKTIYPVSQKSVPLLFWRRFWRQWTNFQKVFTFKLRNICGGSWNWNYLLPVAALPCETKFQPSETRTARFKKALSSTRWIVTRIVIDFIFYFYFYCYFYFFFVFVILLYFNVMYSIFTYILLYLLCYKLLCVCSAFELPVLTNLSWVELKRKWSTTYLLPTYILHLKCTK